MAELQLEIGEEVTYEGKRYKIKSPLTLEKVILSEIGSTNTITASISDLSVAENNDLEFQLEITSVSDSDWEEAKRREKVIQPLAAQRSCSLQEAKNAANSLNIAWRQVYNLINRYRKYDGKLLAHLPGKSARGKGQYRIHSNLEVIIQSAIDDIYLTKQQNKISRVVE